MVDPRGLHRAHLLGEHAELHYLELMLLGERRTCEGRPLQWFIDHGAVDPSQLHARHRELVDEMISRGYNHKSPLVIGRCNSVGNVDVEQNHQHLYNHCAACRERMVDLNLLPACATMVLQYG